MLKIMIDLGGKLYLINQQTLVAWPLSSVEAQALVTCPSLNPLTLGKQNQAPLIQTMCECSSSHPRSRDEPVALEAVYLTRNQYTRFQSPTFSK